MRLKTNNWIVWAIGAAGLVNLVVGLFWQSGVYSAAGAGGLCYFGLRVSGWGPRKKQESETPLPARAQVAAAVEIAPRPNVDPSDTNGLVEEMLNQGRFALLLRPQLAANLTPNQVARARSLFEEKMALVPTGDVVLGALNDRAGDEGELDVDHPRGSVVHVDALFLDRFCVTNREYLEFVQGGGYEQMSIWDPHIWPAVLDFVDSTGSLGPRFWKAGRYAAGEDLHPVVGISWYEASAYARWVGKRLASDAEWVKAGTWPVPISPNAHLQRRYPWGDAMERDRCNLWGSGPGHTAPVADYANGASVGGVYQLIGNVWEWTTGNFGSSSYHQHELSLPTPMKSIRGGAFDTYFENQATCQFQSGENPVMRKHNIGFRCALSMCDVAGFVEPPAADEPADRSESARAGQEVHA